MHGFKTGGSGGGKAENPLNFNVVAYPSEVELNTATADGYTIGVVTTNPIMGWCFASEQPENMVEGEIWFNVSTSSLGAFNALKENTLMVYPVSAKQMVSGALVDVKAKSWIDGAWVDCWNGILYDNGKEVVSWTGGWVEIAGSLYGTGSRLDYIIHYTEEKINVSNFNKLSIHLDVMKGSGLDYENAVIGIASAVTNSSVTAVAYANVPSYSTGQIISLDDLPDGEFYIYLQAPRNQNNDAKVYVYKVWLE